MQLIALFGTITDECSQVLDLPPATHMAGCLPNHSGRNQWTYWLPGLVFEFTLFSLAIARLVQAARARNKAPRVLTVLLRDSILFYGGALSTMACGLIVWASARVRN